LLRTSPIFRVLLKNCTTVFPISPMLIGPIPGTGEMTKFNPPLETFTFCVRLKMGISGDGNQNLMVGKQDGWIEIIPTLMMIGLPNHFGNWVGMVFVKQILV